MTTSLQQTPEGDYLWTYDMNLWTETSLVKSMIKIIFISVLPILFLLLFLALIEGNLGRDFIPIFKTFLLVLGIMYGLLFVAYYLVFIPINGGHYIIVYRMNKNSIQFIQGAKNQSKTDALAFIGFLAGAFANNPTVMGANFLAQARKEMTTFFSKVQTIVHEPKKKQMKLISSDLTRNLICYTEENQLFIEDFILTHCPKARVKTKN